MEHRIFNVLSYICRKNVNSGLCFTCLHVTCWPHCTGCLLFPVGKKTKHNLFVICLFGTKSIIAVSIWLYAMLAPKQRISVRAKRSSVSILLLSCAFFPPPSLIPTSSGQASTPRVMTQNSAGCSLRWRDKDQIWSFVPTVHSHFNIRKNVCLTCNATKY